jgi:hypothetical protein
LNVEAEKNRSGLDEKMTYLLHSLKNYKKIQTLNFNATTVDSKILPHNTISSPNGGVEINKNFAKN